MPMICRGISASNSLMMPLPIRMRSVRGSPFGQYCLAMAWLMITTGAPEALSRSVNDRPRKIGNLEHFEESGRERLPSAAAVERTLVKRTADHAEWQTITTFERNAAGGARANYTRNRTQPLQTIASQLLHRRGASHTSCY